MKTDNTKRKMNIFINIDYAKTLILTLIVPNSEKSDFSQCRSVPAVKFIALISLPQEFSQLNLLTVPKHYKCSSGLKIDFAFPFTHILSFSVSTWRI